MERRWKAVASLAAAIGVIALFTWHVGWGDILSVIQGAAPGPVILGGILSFTGIVLLGVAWWVMLREVAGFTVRDGLRVFFATLFANSVTPFGQVGGEPFIAYLLSRDTDTPIEECFGGVLAADVLNTVPFFTLSLTGILLFLVSSQHPLVLFLLKLVVGILLLGVLVLAVFFTGRRYAVKGFGWIVSQVTAVVKWIGVKEHDALERFTRERVEEKSRNFFDVATETFTRPRTVAAAVVISHFAFLLNIAGLALFLGAVGSNIAFSVLFFVYPVSMLASYLPLPGGLGGIELVLVSLLVTLGGASAASASAAVLLYRFTTYWIPLVIGGVYASHLSVDIMAEFMS